MLLDPLRQLEQHIGPVDIELSLHVLLCGVLLILLPLLLLVIQVGVVASLLEVSLLIVVLILPWIIVGALQGILVFSTGLVVGQLLVICLIVAIFVHILVVLLLEALRLLVERLLLFGAVVLGAEILRVLFSLRLGAFHVLVVASCFRGLIRLPTPFLFCDDLVAVKRYLVFRRVFQRVLLGGLVFLLGGVFVPLHLLHLASAILLAAVAALLLLVVITSC